MDLINDIFNLLSDKLPFAFLRGNLTIFNFSVSRLLVLTVAVLGKLLIAAIIIFCLMIKKSKKNKVEPVKLNGTLPRDSAVGDKKTPPAYSQNEIFKAAITTDYEDVIANDEELDIESGIDLDQIIIADINDSARAAIVDEFNFEVDEFDFEMDMDALSDFGDASHKPNFHKQEKSDDLNDEPVDSGSSLAILEQEDEASAIDIQELNAKAVTAEAQPIADMSEAQPEAATAKEEPKSTMPVTQPEIAAAVTTEAAVKPLSEQNLAAAATSTFAKPAAKLSKQRYERSFSAKLIQSKHENKAMYNLLKNLFMSYDSVRNTISWNYESFIYGRNLIARLYLVGKTLRLFLALNPNDYDINIYHQENKENTAKYRSVPMMVKITSKLALKRAISLVLDLAKANSLVKISNKNVNYINKYAYQSDDVLLRQGLIKIENPLKYKLTDPQNNDNAYEKQLAESKSSGKYTFEKKGDKIYFSLYANNDELLMHSTNGYTTLQGAKRGIATFKKTVKEGEYTVLTDKNGYRFLLRAQGARHSYTGELQATKAYAELAIKKVSLFADIAVNLDKIN